MKRDTPASLLAEIAIQRTRDRKFVGVVRATYTHLELDYARRLEDAMLPLDRSVSEASLRIDVRQAIIQSPPCRACIESLSCCLTCRCSDALVDIVQWEGHGPCL